MDTIDLAALEHTDFRPLVDTEFTLRAGDEEFAVTLTEVSEYPDHRGQSKPSRKPFGLIFKCESALLSQGLYTLAHPKLASFDLFLSPFEGAEGWCNLEAIFN